MYCMYYNAFCYIFYKILWLWKHRRRNCRRRFYCIYSHRALSPYQQQERHHRQKNLRYIYGAGDLPDFSFIDFFACESTDPYMGNFLSFFPSYNCADNIMHFHRISAFAEPFSGKEYCGRELQFDKDKVIIGLLEVRSN